MDKYLTPTIFAASVSVMDGSSALPAYIQTTAKDAGFDEAWLQNAIANCPDIVIAPCSQAGLTDERWWFWKAEFAVEVGPIDLLLVSESGRVAVIETKLAYNPEGRRSVLAQLLDYAVHLGEVEAPDLPELPKDVHLSREDVARRIHDDRDFLLIVAGDELNARAVKLGRSLLGDHLVNAWELALVEVSVFKRSGTGAGPAHLLVPHIRGAIETELRQVVRVVVEGDRSRVVVERVEPEPSDGGVEWNEQSFVAAVHANPQLKSVTRLATELRKLADGHRETQVRWGRGKTASAVLKRRGKSIVEIYAGHGQIVIPKEPDQLARALGDGPARRWLNGLHTLLPEQMKMTRPTVLARKNPPLDDVAALLDEVLSDADKES